MNTLWDLSLNIQTWCFQSQRVPVPALGLLMDFSLRASLLQIDSLPSFSQAQAKKWSTALPYKSTWPSLSSQGQQYVSHLGVPNHSMNMLADCIKALQ